MHKAKVKNSKLAGVALSASMSRNRSRALR